MSDEGCGCGSRRRTVHCGRFLNGGTPTPRAVIQNEILLSEGTYHSTSQDLWDGDDVEYALEKADREQQMEDRTRV